jgi:hypothetical protein
MLVSLSTSSRYTFDIAVLLAIWDRSPCDQKHHCSNFGAQLPAAALAPHTETSLPLLTSWSGAHAPSTPAFSRVAAIVGNIQTSKKRHAYAFSAKSNIFMN